MPNHEKHSIELWDDILLLCCSAMVADSRCIKKQKTIQAYQG